MSDEEKLKAAIAKRAAENAAAFDAEMKARAVQVQVLQGITMQVGLVKCPSCGATLVDPRPKAADDDYDTRM